MMSESQPPDLCDVCSRIDLRDYLRYPRNSRSDRFDYIGPTAEAYKLGRLVNIYRKVDHCALCRLIIKSLCNRRANKTIDPDYYVRSRESTECWIFSFVYSKNAWDDEWKVCRIGVATEMALGPICTPEELAGVIQWCWHPDGEVDRLARGRFIDPRIADFDLIRTWLPTCERLHGGLCDLTAPEVVDGLKIGPEKLIVIDVRNWCLCYLPPGERYTALSYRWPTTGTTFILQQAYFDSLFQEQALGAHIDQLPRKIADAIRCTFFLGEKYIWVDALCIIQDSDDHKAIQISQMDKIYNHAALVIVAASSLKNGNEAYDGLSRFSGAPKEVQQHKEVIQGVTLAVPVDTVFQVIETSQWNTRAWTFQESLLAPRKLYFTDSQVYFECSCSVFCEDTWGEGISPQAFITPVSNLWKMGSPFWMGRSFYGNPNIRRSNYPNHLYFMNDYESFVGDYSNRSMTNPGDILNAFKGIENVLKETGHTEFIYALPKLYLDNMILWTSDSGRRRRSPNGYLPTWSWAGWHGRIGITTYHNPKELLAEAYFYSIDKSCKATVIQTTADQEPGFRSDPQRMGSNNTYFELKGRCDSSLWEHLRVQITRLDKELEYAANEYLGCWTTSANFRVTKREAPMGAQKRLWPSSTSIVVADGNDRWAGCVLMDNRWIEHNLLDGPKTFEFLLMSRSKTVLELTPPQENFDKDEFEVRDWCTLNVMMVNRQESTVERLGVGMIHEDAWANTTQEQLKVLMT